MDPYIARRLVAYRQAELLEEARQSALRAALAQEPTKQVMSMRGMRAAGSLLLRGVTQVWNIRVREAVAVGRAAR